MNTKEKILNKSLELFNIDGVENVTTRHIAKALGMSQGNLHYHYPNKNVLIEVLFENFLAKIQEAARHRKGELFRKEDVLWSMIDNFRIMQDYRFFFKDNEVVWRRLPKIKENIIQLFEYKKLEIKGIIEFYKKEQVFREDISSAQIDYLAEQFIFSITSWLNASEYINTTKNSAQYFAQFTFRLWLPYLKKEAMEAWEAILE